MAFRKIAFAILTVSTIAIIAVVGGITVYGTGYEAATRDYAKADHVRQASLRRQYDARFDVAKPGWPMAMEPGGDRSNNFVAGLHAGMNAGWTPMHRNLLIGKNAGRYITTQSWRAVIVLSHGRVLRCDLKAEVCGFSGVPAGRKNPEPAVPGPKNARTGSNNVGFGYHAVVAQTANGPVTCVGACPPWVDTIGTPIADPPDTVLGRGALRNVTIPPKGSILGTGEPSADPPDIALLCTATYGTMRAGRCFYPSVARDGGMPTCYLFGLNGIGSEVPCPPGIPAVCVGPDPCLAIPSHH